MPIRETLSFFIRKSKWTKSKKKTQKKSHQHPVSDVTDIIRNIDGLDSSYHSFDTDFQYETPPKFHSTPKRSCKSENRKSKSFLVGINSTDFQNPLDKSSDSEAIKQNKIEVVCRGMKWYKRENKKPLMTLMCGLKISDFEKINEMPKMNDSSTINCKQVNRKSWLSLVCGTDKNKSDLTKSVYRDSGISMFSENDGEIELQTRNKFKSKSCDNILDSLHHCEENHGISKSESIMEEIKPSMSNLFRTTSIQENSLRLMRRRHRNVRRRRGPECDSWCSSCEFQDLLVSKSEGDLSRDSIEPEVRFTEIPEKIKAVSSLEVNRFKSAQLKSWQIRRQQRDQKIKEKRESRNLELLLSKEFEFEERLIL